MKPAHESIEDLLNGIIRCHRELELEIESQFEQGVLLDECQPLKDKAFAVYRLNSAVQDLVEAVIQDDFNPKQLKENLVKIDLQRLMKDERHKHTPFHHTLKKFGVI